MLLWEFHVCTKLKMWLLPFFFFSLNFYKYFNNQCRNVIKKTVFSVIVFLNKTQK